ncbi:MAG TPA: hypothetical protein VGB94_11200 [Acidobacteriaceae bacterium]
MDECRDHEGGRAVALCDDGGLVFGGEPLGLTKQAVEIGAAIQYSALDDGGDALGILDLLQGASTTQSQSAAMLCSE